MKIYIYDTTLRDGTQGEGINFSVEDKLAIAAKLDEFGIDYIEGGWPGSNPRDAEFFRRARELNFRHARLAAFGSTRHPQNSVESDANLRELVAAETPTVTIFGKSWELHVAKSLGISLEENLKLIRESVAFLKGFEREVIYDAEHFFDGYRADPDYALSTIRAAEQAGASTIVLCDTNGGSLPGPLSEAVAAARRAVSVRLGIHTHNDSELAVANAIAAVEAGAVHVQGTINGCGERCGNANLCSIIPILELKLGLQTVGREKLRMLTELSRYVSEIANLSHNPSLPFVGKSAFAHKGGIHVSAVLKDAATYEHIDPELVGNSRRVLVSDLSGRSNLAYKAKELGVELGATELRLLLEKLKELEFQGYSFEAAEASLVLLMHNLLGEQVEPFKLEGFRVVSEMRATGETASEATIKVRYGESSEHSAAEGVGPVHALDRALRKSLAKFFPSIREIELRDYKVRVLNARDGTAAKVRVLIESGDGQSTWSTVGVSENILEASWQALVDSIAYKLLKERNRQAAEKAQSASS